MVNMKINIKIILLGSPNLNFQPSEISFSLMRDRLYKYFNIILYLNININMNIHNIYD